MEYDIKIMNNIEGAGRIEVDRLSFICNQLKNISKMSLRLHLFGYSKVPYSSKYNKFVNMYLTGQKIIENATALYLNSDNFSELPIQLNVFQDKTGLKNFTPISLVISSFQEAFKENEDIKYIDGPLIKELLKFRKVFKSDNEEIIMSNRNTIPEIVLTRKKMSRLEVLSKSLPEPDKVTINGRIDEMKYSKNQLVLLTIDNDRIVLNLKGKDSISEISEFFGKEITISGIAYYKPGGQLSYVEPLSYGKPGKNDNFFSRKPNKISVQQEIAFQLRKGKKANPLNDIFGKWPGSESDEEFDEMLKEID